MAEPELRAINLDAYDTRAGWWSPEHGELTIPDGWEFLPRGDAFLTRTVKAAGVYWLAWQPRSRHRPHRRLLGLWAPAAALAEAHRRAETSESSRSGQREVAAQARGRAEDRYGEDLAAAVVEFLDFAPEHAALAEEIAAGAAAQAAVVGSGRVGRARKISVGERAALAARAYIRHRHTDYEDTLGELAASDFWDDEALYQDARAQAAEAVEAFLTHHRRP